jgi:glutamine synthetase
MAEAIQPLEDAKQTQFLMESGVFTVVELKARHNVLAERYIKQIELEAATLAELVDTYVLPSCERELSSRAGLQAKLEKASSKSALKRVTDRLQRAERLYTDLAETRDDLVAGLSKMTQEKDEHKKLKLCAESLMPLMQKTRGISDDVEAEISDEYWALPKYREMLFLN